MKNMGLSQYIWKNMLTILQFTSDFLCKINSPMWHIPFHLKLNQVLIDETLNLSLLSFLFKQILLKISVSNSVKSLVELSKQIIRLNTKLAYLFKTLNLINPLSGAS